MLDDNDIVVMFAKTSDHTGCVKSLLDIEVRTGFVKHVDVNLLYTS